MNATQPADAAALPAHVEETIVKIARLHHAHHQGVPVIEKSVQRVTGFFSLPRAAGLLLIVVGAWVGANLALAAAGRAPFDPPPFQGLQSIVTVLALFMTVFILITQRRDDELSVLREQLTLELAMLAEQKSAKTILLLEELRRDLPTVANRHDPEAEELAQPADTEAVLEALKEGRDPELASPTQP